MEKSSSPRTSSSSGSLNAAGDVLNLERLRSEDLLS
uniref:Uncharacterized protein n=1 Tax=Anguilla anguilla TaxID=7936 RepID=A0A0E9P5H0_ANGAN